MKEGITSGRFNALQARTLSKCSEIASVYDKIREHAEKGNYSVVFTKDLDKGTLDALKKDGYIIFPCGDFGTYTKVSWR